MDNASFGVIPNKEYASVCKFVKLNGFGGDCLNSFEDIFVIVAGLSFVFFRISLTLFLSNILSSLCLALICEPFVTDYRFISQYGSDTNFAISFSFSTITFNVGP